MEADFGRISRRAPRRLVRLRSFSSAVAHAMHHSALPYKTSTPRIKSETRPSIAHGSHLSRLTYYPISVTLGYHPPCWNISPRFSGREVACTNLPPLCRIVRKKTQRIFWLRSQIVSTVPSYETMMSPPPILACFFRASSSRTGVWMSCFPHAPPP